MKAIAIVSNKRNSGKTTTAINLAFGIANIGKDTILIDADEHAKINFYLGPRERNTLDEVLSGKRDIIEATYLHPSGIRIIPSILNRYDKHKVHIKDIIDELKTKTKVLVINSPVEYKNMDMVLHASDEVLLVSLADKYSIKSLKELSEKIESDGKNIIGIVLTKNGKEDYSEYVEKLTGHPVLSVIPEDIKFNQALEQKTPLILMPDKNKAIKSYEKLANMFA
ncbi:MAG: AAA family ATPase [Nanoarchaeota archaeon]|nr:AAA family ATPase [Nanoarchaeota archaeon]